MPGRFRAVLLDMDGTVFDGPYDWPGIRRALGARGPSILTFLEGLAEPERSRKRALLERIESEATDKAVLKRGMRPLLAALKSRGVRTALITNNSRKNLDRLLSRHRLEFDFVLSRDSGMWKPSGAPLRAAMRELGVSPAACCAVGDSLLDVQSAEEAGISCVFVLTREPGRFSGLAVEIVPSVAALRKRLEARA
jgi:HAD superfamily hydrolase (TIGR01509 family)